MHLLFFFILDLIDVDPCFSLFTSVQQRQHQESQRTLGDTSSFSFYVCKGFQLNCSQSESLQLKSSDDDAFCGLPLLAC